MARKSLLALCLCALTFASAHAADFVNGQITVQQPWSRATTATGVIYMTIRNAGPPDTLLGVKTDIAADTALHATVETQGHSEMQPQADGVKLDTGATVAFKPGGLHVMLMGLKHPLKAGEHFRALLRFDQAGLLPVDVVVGGAGATTPPADAAPGK